MGIREFGDQRKGTGGRMIRGGFVDAPESAKRRERALRGKIPGLVGMFWGDRSGNDASIRVPSLSAHVQREPTKSTLGSIPDFGLREAASGRNKRVKRVEIIEVGAARVCARSRLGVRGDVQEPNKPPRHSTATAVAYDRDEEVAFALFSGHATLPVDASGEIRRTFTAKPGDRSQIMVVQSGGAIFRGDLLRGYVGRGSQVDWAVAKFQLPEGSVDASHETRASTPLRLRGAPLGLGAKVKFWSRPTGASSTGTLSTGTLQEVSVGAVTFDLPLGRRPETYSRVASVKPDLDVFCKDGDSGALVFDDSGKVVGTVLGRSSSGDLGYILHVGYLENAMGRMFGLFFRE